MSLHRVYGLTLDTDIPFGCAVSADDRIPIDWTIRWNEAEVDLDARPEGAPVSASMYWPSYAQGDTVVIWQPDNGRFDIDRSRRTITVALYERDTDVAALLLRGVVMSLILEFEGLPVLHANAIEVGGEAIAFAGPQGAGKTTITTALCAVGLPLLTDDVVPIERIGGRLGSRSGLTDLRLRPAAAGLVALFPSADEPFESVDGRTVLQLPPHPAGWLPLHSIVVPTPSADHLGPDRVEPLDRLASLSMLLATFRVENFQDPQLAAARLAIVSALLSEVPVGRLLMPRRATWTLDDAASARAAVEQWHSRGA